MSDPAERFGEAASRLRDVERHEHGPYIHEYVGELVETGEPVRIHTLAPEWADDGDAVDAFERVSDRWYNAGANATIVTVQDRGPDPRPWLALPYSAGETLASVRPELSPDAVGAVVTETADALRTLGLYNTVHGHLSPADIYVTDAGSDEPTVQVGGFGLEQSVRAAVGDHEPTPYTAPELLAEPSQSTGRTDVYGLGAVAYFALTGQPPVDGADLEGAVRQGPTVPPSEFADGVAPALDEVVMRALSAGPDDRQDSPYAFERAFRSAYEPDAFDSSAGGAAAAGAAVTGDSGDDETASEDERPAGGEGSDEAESADDQSDEAESTGDTAGSDAADTGESVETDATESDGAATAGSDGSGLTRRAMVGVAILGGIGAGVGGYLFREPIGELTGTAPAGGEDETAPAGGEDETAPDGGVESDDDTDQVTTRLEGVGTVGRVADDSTIESVELVVKTAPGVDSVDLSVTTLQFIHSSGTTDLTFGGIGGSGSATQFGVQPIQDEGERSLQGDSPVLDDPADRAELVVDTSAGAVTDGTLGEGDTATVRLVTQSGGTTELRLAVPQSLSGSEAVVL